MIVSSSLIISVVWQWKYSVCKKLAWWFVFIPVLCFSEARGFTQRSKSFAYNLKRKPGLYVNASGAYVRQLAPLFSSFIKSSEFAQEEVIVIPETDQVLLGRLVRQQNILAGTNIGYALSRDSVIEFNILWGNLKPSRLNIQPSLNYQWISSNPIKRRAYCYIRAGMSVPMLYRSKDVHQNGTELHFTQQADGLPHAGAYYPFAGSPLGTAAGSNNEIRPEDSRSNAGSKRTSDRRRSNHDKDDRKASKRHRAKSVSSRISTHNRSEQTTVPPFLGTVGISTQGTFPPAQKTETAKPSRITAAPYLGVSTGAYYLLHPHLFLEGSFNLMYALTSKDQEAILPVSASIRVALHVKLV